MKRHNGEGLARRAVTRANSAMRWGAVAGVLLCGPTILWAQGGPRGNSPAAAPASAREQAPYDLSGYWVSLITQNWRLRMVVKGPGDYIGVPINAAALKVADAWTPAAAEAAAQSCAAYGGAIIMWLPERLHISWLDANDLRVDTDAGMQTRLLHFVPPRAGARGAAPAVAPSQPPADTAPSRQGYSIARWVLPGPGQVGRAGDGSIQVTTDHMLPGLFTKNGIPYDGDTKKTEWWDLRKEGSGEQWLQVSTTVEDPHYLTRAFVYDPIFQKEADSAKWDPTPCSLTP